MGLICLLNFYFYRLYLIIILLVLLVMIAGIRFRKKLPLDREKIRPFECGFTPKFNARLPFTLRFFLIALIFLVFDVELVILFPFLVNLFSGSNINIASIVFLLLIILALGLFHEWNQGSLEWAS